MKGDFTRNTFDASKHFSRVFMQQGRVQLDADWNEQSAIMLHYLRALAADLIGPFGGTGDSFEIFTDRKDDEEQLTAAGFKSPLDKGDFYIRGGHYYVNGRLCENEGFALYSNQPDLPAAQMLKDGGAPYLVYLDVWERHVTYLEDDSLREVALGGVDTATRAKIVWQVRIWPGPEDAREPPTTLTRAAVNKDWAEWVEHFAPENRGSLKVRVKPPDNADLNNPCNIPPDARYRGAENQLYRVEIHQGGAVGKGGKAGGATFKWSRENGSVVFPITQLHADVLHLAHLAKDHRLGLKANDWAEIVSEETVLGVAAPYLVQVASIEPMDLTVRFKVPEKNGKEWPFKEQDAPPLLLRRWDHKGDLNNDGGVLLTESEKDWYTLEAGIQIQFQPDDGEYRTGDYWLIPARTATADVEWPRDEDHDPQPRPPHGVKHYYAPLAVISLKNGKLTVEDKGDCRSEIKPLAS